MKRPPALQAAFFTAPRAPTPSCQPLFAPLTLEKRDTSSIPPRFIRHRRRFGEIHIGAATVEAQKRIGAEIAEIIKNF